MARYHINPETKEPGLCHAKTEKNCKFKQLDGSIPEHFTSKAAATEASEKMLTEEFNGNLPARPSDTEWNDSVVRDGDGKLLTVFHGSSVDFDHFDSEFTGHGNDSYGSGFYFNTDEETSKGYGGFVKAVHLNIRNPVIIDGHENMSVNKITIPSSVIREMLKDVPNIYAQPDNDDEMNPLGDYVEEFWDQDTWSREELDAMRERMFEQHFKNATWSQMEELFGDGDNAEKFRRSLAKHTGWDGVHVTFEQEGTSHWIAWFPEQIRTL